MFGVRSVNLSIVYVLRFSQDLYIYKYTHTYTVLFYIFIFPERNPNFSLPRASQERKRGRACGDRTSRTKENIAARLNCKIESERQGNFVGSGATPPPFSFPYPWRGQRRGKRRTLKYLSPLRSLDTRAPDPPSPLLSCDQEIVFCLT